MNLLADQTIATAPPSIALVIAAATLITGGVYLMLARSLVRVLLGVVLAGNGITVLFLIAGGRAGSAPLRGDTPVSEMADPLPQAMVLTAIVIALATVAFVLALAYRDWRLNGTDDVQDDIEDARIRQLADRDQTSSTYDADDTSITEAEEDPEAIADAEAESAARAYGMADQPDEEGRP